jgi:signal transduction histidine kinase
MRVTHELRTPLTAISGHVQAVTEGVVGPDELDESLEAVNEEVRRLDRLVGDLLDLTRLEAHQFRVVREEVGLEALLEQAAGAFREKARAVDIDFSTPIDGAPTVITDGDRVLQIVNNLLDNAFRWTPRGGKVELGCVTSNGIAAIKVTDTGRGIAPAEREAVFHPFYSRRGEGGTGLGLSISRELAQALGGRLSVESEPGSGSTFTLSLPRKKRKVLL